MRGPGFWKHGGYGRMGFLYKHYTGMYRPFMVCHPKEVDCPEREEQVHFSECLECEKFQIWHEKDGELRRCYHEFKDLESRGFYDDTFDDHPENFDPETFERIQERKHLNEEINRELELERIELEWKAEELSKKIPDDYYQKYGPEEEWNFEELEAETADPLDEYEDEEYF